MAQYRVKSGMYVNASLWFLPQKKGWFFWYDIQQGYGTSKYFSSLEAAKKAIETEKTYSQNKHQIVWEE